MAKDITPPILDRGADKKLTDFLQIEGKKANGVWDTALPSKFSCYASGYR